MKLIYQLIACRKDSIERHFTWWKLDNLCDKEKTKYRKMQKVLYINEFECHFG